MPHADPEVGRAYDRRYRAEHPEARREAQARYAAAHPDRILAKDTRYKANRRLREHGLI